jgi:hypothetical protein
MSAPTCVMRASGKRFAAKRYLATSSMVPERVEDNAFELTVSRAAATDHTALVDDMERFLTEPQLDLSRLFAFPGVEHVVLLLRCGPTAERPLVLPPRICAALGKLGLELELRHG